MPLFTLPRPSASAFRNLHLLLGAVLMTLLLSCQPPTTAPSFCETDRFFTPEDYLPSPGFLREIYTYPPSAAYLEEWTANNPEADFPEVFSYCSYRTESEGAAAWLSCVQVNC